MITYKTNIVNISIPVLHKVIYGTSNTHEPWSAKDREVHTWCCENCDYPFYMSPTWNKDRFVEFQCDEEAVMFRLAYA